MTNGCIDLTETERVRFVRGNVVTELRRIKENGDGMVVAYGGETGVLLLDNGLADEIVMTTVPVLVGNGEKGLECGPTTAGYGPYGRARCWRTGKPNGVREDVIKKRPADLGIIKEACRFY